MSKNVLMKEGTGLEFLDKVTAAELMTPNPVSLRADASVLEATGLFADRGFTGAPVIDEAGKPIGVISSVDLLVHGREQARYAGVLASDYYGQDRAPVLENEGVRAGFQIVDVDRTPVRFVMTPMVFSVPQDCTARHVVEKLLGLRIHRLFVVDGGGVLVGIISTLDVLKRLLGA